MGTLERNDFKDKIWDTLYIMSLIRPWRYDRQGDLSLFSL